MSALHCALHSAMIVTVALYPCQQTLQVTGATRAPRVLSWSTCHACTHAAVRIASSSGPAAPDCLLASTLVPHSWLYTRSASSDDLICLQHLLACCAPRATVMLQCIGQRLCSCKPFV